MYDYSNIFRLALAWDIQGLTQLDLIYYPPKSDKDLAERFASVMGYIENPDADVICIVDRKNNLVGSASINYKGASSSIASLDRFNIHPRYRGYGLSKILLRQTERQARRKGVAVLQLECSEENRIALNLYLQSGYRLIGQEDSYEDGSAALIFRRNLRCLFALSPCRPPTNYRAKTIHAKGYPVSCEI